MITLPLLLLVGIPPHQALATNKLQSSFGSLTATLRYRSGGLMNIREMLPGIGFTLAGALMGTLAVQALSSRLLNLAIPVILSVLFLFMLRKKDLGNVEAQQKLPRIGFYALFGLALGFYDGFFGPGAGSFWTIAFIAIAGMNMKSATGHTKVVNFTSNIVSLGIFAFSGNLLVVPGLLMAMGQVAGAWVGSHQVLRRDSSFVRVMFLSVLALSIIYLGWRAYFGGMSG